MSARAQAVIGTVLGIAIGAAVGLAAAALTLQLIADSLGLAS